MNYDEEEIDEGFKVGGVDEDEPVEPLEDVPVEMPDLDDDPDNRYH